MGYAYCFVRPFAGLFLQTTSNVFKSRIAQLITCALTANIIELCTVNFTT